MGNILFIACKFNIAGLYPFFYNIRLESNIEVDSYYT